MDDDRKCPYLPGKTASYQEYYADELGSELHGRILNMGFRRSGHLVYRPQCPGCSECREMRVLAWSFIMSGSMKRILRKNADVSIEIARPFYTDEKYELFKKYLDFQHDKTMSRSMEAFVSFLYDSPAETLEIVYTVSGRIMGISIADIISDGLSSVYMYFDPDYAKRSPGTFSVLSEISLCRRLGQKYYYLGYLVNDCPKMKYKARFRPFELLSANGIWEENHCF